jgi:RNA polymerase sigma factor (sigma-70 family)
VAVRDERQRREAEAPDDGALVARARAGDGAAYAALVTRHREAALRLAQRITGEPGEAEDAVQDALLKAHVHLDRFRDGAPFRPWLLQIVANEARNRRTAAARRRALERRAADASGPARPGSVPPAAPGPTPDEAALAEEARRIVAGALRTLRAEDRTAITCRYLHDLSEAETAAALGLPRGTVKSRLSRALARLRAVAVPALLAAVLLALAGGALALFPPARSAIGERLGLRGVRIEHVPAVPPAPASPAAPATPAPAGPEPPGPGAGGEPPAPPPVGPRLGLGQPVSLEAARPGLSFAPLLPSLPELGPPDEAYAAADTPGGRLTLLYRARPGLPEAGETGAALLVTEMRGSVGPAGTVTKLLGPQTRLEEVAVNGGRGYWIEGQAHVVFVRDSGGAVRDETLRLAGNTLLWEQGGLTLRLELAGSREQALRIAAAMAP